MANHHAIPSRRSNCAYVLRDALCGISRTTARSATRVRLAGMHGRLMTRQVKKERSNEFQDARDVFKKNPKLEALFLATVLLDNGITTWAVSWPKEGCVAVDMDHDVKGVFGATKIGRAKRRQSVQRACEYLYMRHFGDEGKVTLANMRKVGLSLS